MKRLLITGVLCVGLGLGLSAQATPSDWMTDHANVKVSDLTVGDLTALAQAESVQLQKARYVMSAGMASYVLPGLGQFKVGDATGGALRLLAQVAIVGGTAYGVWALTPDDLKAAGLTHDARKALLESYFATNPEKLWPAMGVMAGGMTLALVNQVWAAKDARAQAAANVKDGKVTFEPLDMGEGFGVRMRY